MANQIFPKEILDNTTEVFRHNQLKRSHHIYSVILIFVFLTFALFPLIKIDLYSSARGQIRSKTKRTEILSPTQGIITDVFIQENQSVSRGDTLIKFDDQLILSQLANLENEIELQKDYIHDLSILVQGDFNNIDSIQTSIYKSEWKAYLAKLKDLNRHYQKQNTDFIRQKKLYTKGVIAKVHYLKSEFQVELSQNKIDLFKRQHSNAWQSLQSDFQVELEKLRIRKLQLNRKKSQHSVIANLDGTIQDLHPMAVGQNLSQSQRIAVLSPDNQLVVECYVSSSDIGFLKEGVSVKYQIDAFNHQFWGMKSGTVINVAKDITLFENVPLYKVLCSVNNYQLKTGNNHSIKLQKGMQLTVRFFIARRSLFQLLFDKVHHWIKDR